MSPEIRAEIDALKNRIAELERDVQDIDKVRYFDRDIRINGEIILPGGARIVTGHGSPDNVSRYNYPIGSMYLRLDGGAGTTLYMKEAAAASGWDSTA